MDDKQLYPGHGRELCEDVRRVAELFTLATPMMVTWMKNSAAKIFSVQQRLVPGKAVPAQVMIFFTKTPAFCRAV